MPEFAPYLLKVRALKSESFRIQARMAHEQPIWIKDTDARSVAIQTISNCLRFAELGLVYIESYLSSPGWWIELRGASLTSNEFEFEFLAYVECTKFGLFHTVFSGVEASFRAFLRAIDPSAAQEGRAQFEGVSVCLLKTHLKLLPRDLDLIELLRLIRNTIHNEGVHRPPGGGNRVVVLDGTSYEFEDGKPVEFVTWQFLLDRIGDLLHLQEKVVFHPLLASSLHYIPSPAATVLDAFV